MKNIIKKMKHIVIGYLHLRKDIVVAKLKPHLLLTGRC